MTPIRHLTIPQSLRANPFKGIEGLLESIRSEGILEPIHVIEKDNGEIVIRNGLRRLYCAIALGMIEVPTLNVDAALKS